MARWKRYVIASGCICLAFITTTYVYLQARSGPREAVGPDMVGIIRAVAAALCNEPHAAVYSRSTFYADRSELYAKYIKRECHKNVDALAHLLLNINHDESDLSLRSEKLGVYVIGAGELDVFLEEKYRTDWKAGRDDISSVLFVSRPVIDSRRRVGLIAFGLLSSHGEMSTGVLLLERDSLESSWTIACRSPSSVE